VDPDTARMKLSDKQIVALYLVAMKISKELGKSEYEKVTVSHIQSATALNPKSISSRLSELVKSGHVLKEVKRDTSQTGFFFISTAGIHWLALSFSKKNSLG
jgi:RIO-like serine/threonine protein kinase